MNPEIFEQHRPHLRNVARRMLGSAAEADDAVQETWLRADAADSSDVENVGGWLTTIVARVCLNLLRSRNRRPVDPIDDPVVVLEGSEPDPEQEAVLADSVGLALQIVLDTLAPGERLAFVLHDLFAMPFDQIAEIVGRSPDAARQLASRARRRVQGAAVPDPDLARQREVVDAFFAAARGGDLDGLLAVLDPEVVLRTDRAADLVRGAVAVAGNALMFADPDRELRPALVNGNAGVVISKDGRTFSVMGFTVVDGRIVAIEAYGDEERLARVL